MLYIDIDFSPLERDVKRLKRVPNERDKARLDRTLKALLEKARAAVHVDTNSLKPSGTSESRLVKGRYTGKFSFGGITTGPKNPVDYAIYEQRRGGSHDFMAVSGSYQTDAAWIRAIQEVLSG